MSDYSWNFSDWESALGISSEDLEDEIKGIDESKALKTTKAGHRHSMDHGLAANRL